MKQNLESAAAFEVQSLNQCDAILPAPASEIDGGPESRSMSSVHVSENPSGGVAVGSVVNGYIVYSRTKKSRHLCNGSSEGGSLKRLKTSQKREANDLLVVDGVGGVLVDNVENKYGTEVDYNLEKRNKCDELKSEPVHSLAGEGGSVDVPVKDSNDSEGHKKGCI